MSTVTDQIKERIDIVDLVREYVPELKKAGANWKARCPFHQEKTPSFTVSQDKQFFHCFGCSAGGDIFEFLQKVEGMEFTEALQILAKRAGVELERQSPQEQSERGRLLEIMRQAARWYHAALLKAKSAVEARAYVEKRGITTATRDTWQLGFAPDAWDGLLKFLESRSFRPQEISRAGLAAANDRGGYYDRFRYRLMFPVSDVHGNVIGFAGRKLKEDDFGGKYINTPETPLYHKGSVLYGLHLAKQAIRATDRVIVVEGNMDVISSHQAGVTNTVASSGTALTPEQIRLLKRFTKNICLAFDPDAAGQEALVRGLSAAWQEDMMVRIIELPEGKDPDALVRDNPAEWQHRVEGAINFMDWLFSRIQRTHDLKTGEGKKLASRELLPWIARVPDAIERAHYLQLLARLIQVDEPLLRTELSKYTASDQSARAVKSQASEKAATTPHNPVRETGMRLVALLALSQGDDQFFSSFNLQWLRDPEITALYNAVKIFYDKGEQLDLDTLHSSLPEGLATLGRELSLVTDELASTMPAPLQRQERDTLTNRLKRSFLKRELNQLREQIRDAETAGDAVLVSQYVSKWQTLSQELAHTVQ